MPNATFVLMNCDLVAVPLQLGAGVVTVYCGARRADQLLGGSEHLSDARRLGCAFVDDDANAARREGGSKSRVDTRPPVNREISSQRSAGA